MKYGLREKLLFPIILTLIAGALTFVALSSSRSRTVALTTLTGHLNRQNYERAMTINLWFEEWRGDLRQLAAQLAQAERRDGAITLAEKFGKGHPVLGQIAALQADGDLVWSAGDEKLTEEDRAAIFEAGVADSNCVSKPLRNSASGSSYFWICAEVTDVAASGGVSVLAGRVGEENFARVMGLPPENDSAQYVVAESGQVVFQQGDLSESNLSVLRRVLSGFEVKDSQILESEQGERFIVAKEIISAAGGWMLVETLSLDKSMASESAAAKNLALLALLVVFIGFLVVSVLVRHMLSRRLNEMLEVIERVEKGDLSARIAAAKRMDEVGVLTTAFNAMTERLENTMFQLTDEVAERQRMEREVQASEERYRLLVENSSDGVAVCIGTKFAFANQRAEEILDCGREKLQVREFSDFIHPDDKPAFKQFFENKSDHKKSLLLRIFPAGSSNVKWLSLNRVDIQWEGQDGNLFVFSDVTQQKQAEEELRRSEENLEITLNSIADAVIATDSAGVITRMNPVAETLTETTADKALGKDVDEVFKVISPESRKPIENPVLQVLRTGKSTALSLSGLVLDSGSTERQIADSAAPIRDKQGNMTGAVLVFRDVTEENMLQEQLKQSQKMEALGKLAGGVAHDFNNILGAIVGYGELIKVHSDDESIKQKADSIIQMSRDAAALTSQLLTFARREKSQTVPVQLNSVIAKAVEILDHTIDKRITIHRDMQAANDLIMGDPAQLQNAVLNLGINARDAMPEGGELTFSTKNVSLDEMWCQAHSYDIKPGEYIELAVADTGCGMSPEIQERAFEPFFTTKNEGEGTGMGLAAVYGAVRSHAGSINVVSEQSRGSIFKVYLPLVSVQKQSEAIPETASVEQGSGHVLFVDDDENMRKIAEKLLQVMGYSVTVLADGREAVEYYREHSDDVDLVVLDVIMPNLNGRDACREIKEIDPGARVIFCTGYSMENDVDELLRAGGAAVLHKPFGRTEFSQKIAEAIKS